MPSAAWRTSGSTSARCHHSLAPDRRERGTRGGALGVQARLFSARARELLGDVRGGGQR
jgi:hypothetical protein